MGNNTLPSGKWRLRKSCDKQRRWKHLRRPNRVHGAGKEGEGQEAKESSIREQRIPGIVRIHWGDSEQPQKAKDDWRRCTWLQHCKGIPTFINADDCNHLPGHWRWGCSGAKQKHLISILDWSQKGRKREEAERSLVHYFYLFYCMVFAANRQLKIFQRRILSLIGVENLAIFSSILKDCFYGRCAWENVNNR